MRCVTVRVIGSPGAEMFATTSEASTPWSNPAKAWDKANSSLGSEVNETESDTVKIFSPASAPAATTVASIRRLRAPG